MNFDFSEHEFVFLAELETMVAEYAGCTETETAAAADGKAVREFLKKLAGTPYLKLGLSEVEGMGMATLAAAWEGFASRAPSLYLAVETSTRLFGRLLAKYGVPEQRDRWLGPLLAGDLVGTVALSENTINVDNDPMATVAAPEGEDYSLRGAKNHVIGANYADVCAVVAAINGKLGVFFVERGAGGMDVSAPLSTAAYTGAALCGLTFNGCKVRGADMVGPFDAKKLLEELRMWENQILLGASLGSMRASMDAAKQYAKEHRTGGKPIIAYQEVGFQLAEMLTSFQTSQLMVYRTMWLTEAGDSDVRDVTLCAKVFCTESAEEVASKALQVLGGQGLLAGHPAEAAYRNTKFGQVCGTSTEIARVRIGDSALGYK
ncbi:MAG: acyl-CoA dehydrogenase family protein [Desulfatibacillaceae bacterium]